MYVIYDRYCISEKQPVEITHNCVFQNIVKQELSKEYQHFQCEKLLIAQNQSREEK